MTLNLFVIINFFKIGFSVNLINLTLTFISTFLCIGIYLISKF